PAQALCVWSRAPTDDDVSFHRRSSESVAGMASRQDAWASGPERHPIRCSPLPEKNMSMFNKVTKTFQWGQHSVTLETGEVARQAGGAVIVNIEDTMVLATVVGAKNAKP